MSLLWILGPYFCALCDEEITTGEYTHLAGDHAQLAHFECVALAEEQIPCPPHSWSGSESRGYSCNYCGDEIAPDAPREDWDDDPDFAGTWPELGESPTGQSGLEPHWASVNNQGDDV